MNTSYHLIENNSNGKKRIKKKLISLKVLLLFVFIAGFFVYLMEFSTIGQYIVKNFDFYNGSGKLLFEQEDISDESYFVNTVGCKMPSFPILNDNIKNYMQIEKATICRKPLTIADDKYLFINLNKTELKLFYNVTDIKKLQCSYEPFRRLSDNRNEYYNNYNDLNTFNYGEKKEIKDEFIKVICNYGNISKFYRDYHYFVPSKLIVENRCDKILRKTQNTIYNNNYNDNNKLNVIVIGLDSLSRLNFRRQMTKTAEILETEFNTIEFLGYNKVEDNTYPNLIPALTGFNTQELADACLSSNEKNTTFDKCHFIWKTFMDAGYISAFSEDIGYLGLFNYFRKGFINQPTDYYSRSLFIELEKNIATNKNLNVFMCLGSKSPFHVLMDYTNKFINAIFGKPFFSFFWSSSYTHDYFNTASLIDNDMTNFLLNLKRKQIFKNSILFLMSDHGIRWGSFRNTYQGMMEERQPFLYILLPDKFDEKFQFAFKNLKINRRRLTTHYDLYETLKDLVNITRLTNNIINQRSHELQDIEPLPRGISLFLQIPKTRTCENSGIGLHWCTCHEKQSIQTTDYKVQISARFIVKNINVMLEKYPQCQKLYLNSINEATLGTTNTNITLKSSTKHFSDLTIRLITKPGGGEFEATVRLDSHNNSILTGTISRTNLYGKQSVCVDDYAMKLYCFCDR